MDHHITLLLPGQGEPGERQPREEGGGEKGGGNVEERKVKMYRRGRNGGEGKGVCVLGMDGK